MDVTTTGLGEMERTVRRRALRLLGWFVVVQAAVAVSVVVAAKFRHRDKRARARQSTYPSHGWPTVQLAASADLVKIYTNGSEYLDDLIAAIDAAHHQVLFETFILDDDASGREVRSALVRAADRGVKVFVLWDWVLSDHSLDESWFPPNVETFIFKRMRPGLNMLRPSNLLRDHRKLVVVDQSIGFVGGYNVGDEYLRWRDTHLRIEGTAARDLANAFGDFWNLYTPALTPRLDNVVDRPWDAHVLVHRNDPTMATFPIRGIYLEAMDRAQERIWLTTAYFIPDRAFRSALVTASRRGVDVRILLPEDSNHPLTDQLAHGAFDELMSAGVRIFLYRDHMLHAKTCLVDREWITVGTANIDRWSMVGNHEINVELRDSTLNEIMAEIFELDLTNADEVHLEGWRRRPLQWRMTERILRSLAPLL